MISAATSSVDYRDVGRMLKDTRESYGIALDEISRTLHIRAPFLAALEKGDFSMIPGEVYVRGYMKRYAAYLGYDTAILLGQGAPSSAKAGKAVRYQPPDRSNRPRSTLGLVLAFGLLLGIAAAFEIRRQESEAPTLVEPLPSRFLPMLDLGTPRAPAAASTECEGSAGAVAQALCEEQDRVLAHVMNEGPLLPPVSSLSVWPIEPETAAPPVEDEALTPTEAIDSTLAPSTDTAQPDVASPDAPKYQEPLWMNPFRK